MNALCGLEGIGEYSGREHEAKANQNESRALIWNSRPGVAASVIVPN